MKQYLKKNSNQAGLPRRTAKRAKQDRRWTLLFIGNHGRTVTLKRFKGIVLVSLLVLAVAIAVSAGLLVWNQKIIMANHGLRDELKMLNERLDALRHEKDILLTRLVVAESRVKESLRRPTEETDPDKLAVQQQPVSEDADQAKPAVAQKIETPTPPKNEPPKSDASSDTGLSVAIEDFQILNPADDNRLKVQFKIKNTSPNSQRVSGHAIVVLKGEQNSWLPMPWIQLVDGRPTGKQRGYSFGINYFKTLRFSTPSPQHPEKFETASVYVFTRKGDLLLEKGYPVKLSPNKPQYAKPLPGMHALPTEDTETPAAPPPASEAAPPPASEAAPPPASEAAPPSASEAAPPPPSLRDAFREALEDTSSP